MSYIGTNNEQQASIEYASLKELALRDEVENQDEVKDSCRGYYGMNGKEGWDGYWYALSKVFTYR